MREYECKSILSRFTANIT
uniref:Uncharacterized protein n=1 Tax=Anguilla anguilla TaxID=7936 RepID=A0A0E9UXE1_ANGAN